MATNPTLYETEDGRKVKFKFRTAKQFEDAFDKWMKECEATYDKNYKGRKKAPTVAGLALMCGFECRESLLKWERKDIWGRAIKRAKLQIEAWLEEAALVGKVYAAPAIFNQKNNYGYNDTQYIEQKDTTPLNSEDEKIFNDFIARIENGYFKPKAKPIKGVVSASPKK